MSRDERNADDLSGLPFASDDERAEFDWLMARAADSAAPAPSAQVANEYADVERWLGELPSPPLDEAWHEQVLQRARAMGAPAKPRVNGRGRWIAVGGGLLAAAVILVLIRPSTDERHTDAAALQVAFRLEPQHTRSAGGPTQHVIGAEAITYAPIGAQITSAPRPPSGELRLYQGDTMVARCPGTLHCSSDAQGDHLAFTLNVPGRYSIVVVNATELPTTGTLLDLKTAATKQRASLQETEIDVR